MFLPLLVGVGIVYGIYVGPFYTMLHVTPAGIEEMLSIPLPQMARVYRFESDSLEKQDVDLRCSVVP